MQYYKLTDGTLIVNTAKGLLPALKRSTRSKYKRHIGNKERQKVLNYLAANPISQ